VGDKAFSLLSPSFLIGVGLCLCCSHEPMLSADFARESNCSPCNTGAHLGGSAFHVASLTSNLSGACTVARWAISMTLFALNFEALWVPFLCPLQRNIVTAIAFYSCWQLSAISCTKKTHFCSGLFSDIQTITSPALFSFKRVFWDFAFIAYIWWYHELKVKEVVQWCPVVDSAPRCSGPLRGSRAGMRAEPRGPIPFRRCGWSGLDSPRWSRSARFLRRGAEYLISPLSLAENDAGLPCGFWQLKRSLTTLQTLWIASPRVLCPA
jgi:hypothetical protein